MLMDLISCCGLYFFFLLLLFPLCTSSHRGAAVGEAEDGDEPGERDFDGGGKLEREL